MIPINMNDIIGRYAAGETITQLSKTLKIDRNKLAGWMRQSGIQLRARTDRAKLAGGVVVPESIIERYVAGETIIGLAVEIGIFRSTLARHLRWHGVTLRTASEASVLDKTIILDTQGIVQLFDSGETIRNIAAVFGVTDSTIARRLKMAGCDTGGKTRAMQLRWKALRANPSAWAAYTNAISSSNIGRVASTPSKIKQAITKYQRQTNISPHEVILKESLATIGYRLESQFPIGPYNIDLSDHELRVAVEVECGPAFYGNRAKTLKRTKYILDQGWRVLFIVHYGHGLVIANVAKQVVAFLQAASRNEPTFSGYGVINRQGKVMTSPRANLHDLARIPGF